MSEDSILFYILPWILFGLLMMAFQAMGPLTGENWPLPVPVVWVFAAVFIAILAVAGVVAAVSRSEVVPYMALLGLATAIGIGLLAVDAFAKNSAYFLSESIRAEATVERTSISKVSDTPDGRLSFLLEDGREMVLPAGYVEGGEDARAGDTLLIYHERMDAWNCDAYAYGLESAEGEGSDEAAGAQASPSAPPQTSPQSPDAPPQSSQEPSQGAQEGGADEEHEANAGSSPKEDTGLRSLFTKGGEDGR